MRMIDSIVQQVADIAKARLSVGATRLVYRSTAQTRSAANPARQRLIQRRATHRRRCRPESIALYPDPQGFFIVWAPPRLATEVATEEPASWSSTCVDEGLSTQVAIAAPQRPLGAI